MPKHATPPTVRTVRALQQAVILPAVIPVAHAAKHLGISGRVMRRWLEQDLGYVFRGKRKLVRVEDVATVL